MAESELPVECEDLANARLIAAAPDLLAACEQLLSWRLCDYCVEDGCNDAQDGECDCPYHVDYLRIRHEANSAIAKAHGREVHP